MPETELADAVQIAERVRTAVAENAIEALDGRKFSVTATIGVVELAATDAQPQDLVQRASAKVIEGKNGGRNQVCS